MFFGVDEVGVGFVVPGYGFDVVDVEVYFGCLLVLTPYKVVREGHTPLFVLQSKAFEKRSHEYEFIVSFA